MSKDDKSYGGSYASSYGAGQGSYSTSVQYGSQTAKPAPQPAKEPASPAPKRPSSGLNLGLGGNSTPQNLISDTTTASFQKDVIDASKEQPILIDFWAPWCGPCKQLTPLLERAVNSAGGAVKLVKMNIDDHPSIPGQLGIKSIPAVIAFKDGQPVDGFMGAVPESQINEFIEKLSAPAQDPIEAALEMANEAVGAGDKASALQIFSAIIAQQPDNLDALVGAATIFYDDGQREQTDSLIEKADALDPENEKFATLKARICLDEEVAKLGDPNALQQRLDLDDNDHEARFDLAKIENARDNRETAANHLLTILQKDRSWNDEAARALLLQFFDVWGVSDPASLQARRKLSSLLFS